MTRSLAFVVSRAYKECKLRSILLKCARTRTVHAARLGTFCRPFEYSGLTPCIVANQHLSRNFCLRDTSAQGYVPDWGRDYVRVACNAIVGKTVTKPRFICHSLLGARYLCHLVLASILCNNVSADDRAID